MGRAERQGRAARGGWRRALRIVAWVVGLAVAVPVGLLSAAILYARTDAGRARVRTMVLQQARQTIPGLQLAHIGGDYVRELYLDDVSIFDRAGRQAVHADRVYVGFDLLPLLRHTVRVRELRVEAPRVLGRLEADGTSNLAHLTAPPPAQQPAAQTPAQPSGPAWNIHVDRLRIVDGGADVETAEDERAMVSGLHIDGAARVDGGRIDATLDRLALHATRAGAAYDLALAGHARLDPVGAGAVDAALSTLHVAGLLPADALDGTVRVQGPMDAMRVDVALAAGAAGVLALHGTVGLARDAAGARTLGAYDLALEGRELVLRRLAAAAPEGHLTLSLSARGRGAPLAAGSTAAVNLDVQPGRVAGVAFQRVQLQATSEGPRWRLPRAAVRASGVTLNLAAEGEGNRVSGDLDAALDGALGGRARRGSPLPDVRGRGRLSMHVDGVVPRQVAVTARVDAQNVATGELRLAAAKLNLRGRADLPQGTAVRAEQARVEVQASGRVSGLRAGAARLQSATLAARLAGTMAAPRGTVDLTARGLLAAPDAPQVDTVTLNVASDGGGLRVHAAAAGPRLRGGVDMHGELTPRLARVTVDRLSLGFETHRYKQSLALQRPTTVVYRAGDEVTLDATEVRGTGLLFTGALTAGGRYSLAADSRRDALGELSLALRQASFGGEDRIDGELHARLQRRQATATLDARLGPTGASRVHLDADVPVVVPRRGGAPTLARRGPVTIRLRTAQVKLQELSALQRRLSRYGLSGGTVSVDVAVTGDIRQPDVAANLDLRDLMLRNVTGLGRDSRLRTIPGVGATIRVDTKPGSVHVNAQALLRGTGIVLVDARSPLDLGKLIAGEPVDVGSVPLHASIDIPKFKLESLAEFTDAVKGVQGTLLGHVELDGAPDRISGRGDINVQGARVDQVAFQKVLLHGEAAGGRIDVEANLTQATGGALYGKARIERAGKGALTAHLSVKDLDLGFARVFLPGVREIGGMAQANVDATGTLAAPVVRGSLALGRGRLGLVGQPTFQHVALAASVRPGRADLTQLSLYSGGGSLTGKGWAALDAGLRPQSAVFTAHADDFLVAAAGSTGARINGEIAVEGALRDAVLAGKVKVPRAVIWLPKGVSGGSRNLQRVGPHADVRFTDEAALAAARQQEREQRESAAEPTRVDLRAVAGPVYIRSKDMDLEVESRVRYATITDGANKGKQGLRGAVHIRRGRIALSGQRFDIDHGDVTFDGSPQPNPSLDIRLTHQYQDALVAIELRGTPKNPLLRLISDPPIYDQAQIVSLLLTGQPGGQPSTGKSFDPTAAVATMVLGKLADKVAPELGLDVLRVENVEEQNAEGRPTGDTDTRIEVGKYVSDRVFLSYAHVFGAAETENRNEAHVEYRLTRRWMVETVFGDAGVGGVDALWTYRH